MKNAVGFADEAEHEQANKFFSQGALTTPEKAVRQVLKAVAPEAGVQKEIPGHHRP
jgi:hypothetical protein